MLAIKQKTKILPLLNSVLKNHFINFTALLFISVSEIYYLQTYIFLIFTLTLLPVTFFRYKTYHKEEYFQFFEKFFVYKNPYKQDIIIYFEDIESVKMKYSLFSWKYIFIELKNKSIVNYDKNKGVKIYDFLNYKEVIKHLEKRITV